MLLWTTLLCLFSASLVASQFAKPEVLADYDPNTALQPLKNNLQNKDSSGDLHVIRGLLISRQSCPAGSTECTNVPGKCCPVGGSCCQDGCCKAGYYCYSTGCCATGTTGCEGNSCCTSTETCCTGGGCCESGYHCVTVNGERGCCLDGKTCTGNDTPQCNTPTYVVCPGETFCCPPGYKCFRDTAGNPMCSAGGNTSIPPSLTNSNTNGPTFNGSSSTTSKGPSTISVPPLSSSSTSSRSPTPRSSSTSSRSSTSRSPSTSSRAPTPSPSTSNSGASSSAVSIVVDAILASFAGVSAFVFLF